ncbi:tetratricopeptide repeat protein [Streptomyces sp. MNU76]|uniref:tetratricopeptide repeat protein n=1 Tax=Streptomyces sp. MNU76 TaxID=2560026 RepID=UPI001E3E36C8|nr:tetratricopeptide repeat protein [Streptomyces sp. MNU76]MCC9707130.1 tetratricopeptide repeat protein [Streptomyces sp. MNU76]
MVGTDVYTAFKTRLGSLFRRGGPEQEDTFLSALEERRNDLTLARDRGDEARVAELVPEIEELLRSELRQLLEEQPSLAGELRDLHNEVRNVVTNGTLVMGSHTHVSNVYNHYYGGGPAIPRQAVPGTAAPLPRIVLWPMDHYENNVDLLRGMDAVWAKRQAAGVATTMYVQGVPGSGTSAVAREWLRRHQEELTGPQLEASLGRDTWGNLPEPTAILERWFRELGVPAEDVPADPGERSKYFRSVAADRGPIVVLLEDVVLASQVEPLLPGTPGSVALITSHSRLPRLIRTVGAEPFEMKPLERAHSRKLLVNVGGIRGNATTYEKELDLIADGCGDLPLALCIAGAQLALGHVGRVRELATELSDRTTRLEALDMDDEISAALGPGYRGLAPDAARLYRCIGLHPAGRFEADVVRAMLPDLDTAARNKALRQLTAANLIEPDGDGYRVRHHLIHDHALACALADEPAEIREAVLDRIIAHYLEFAERAEAALSSRHRHDPSGAYAAYAPTGSVDAPGVIASLERRRESLENVVRLAHEQGRHDQTWRLAQGQHTFHLKCGLHNPWITMHELALESAHECRDQMAIARMHFELGFAHLDRWSARQGDPQTAREHFESALELVRPADGNATEGQRRTESSALEGLGLLERKLGRPAAALEYYDLGLRALDGIGHKRGRALFALHRGVAFTDLRRHDEAARELRSAREQFAALSVPDPYNEARALTRYAEDRRAAEQPGEAVRALDEAIEIMTVNGPPYQRAGILLLRGDMLSAQGDHARATLDWVTAGDLFREANSLRAQEADRRLTDASGAGDEDGSQDGDVE